MSLLGMGRQHCSASSKLLRRTLRLPHTTQHRTAELDTDDLVLDLALTRVVICLTVLRLLLKYCAASSNLIELFSPSPLPPLALLKTKPVTFEPGPDYLSSK